MDDLISRQAAIEALDKRFDSIPMEQTSEILMLRKDLRELPPAQPEKRTETHSCDCISRQAAIEGKICIQRANGVEIYDDYVVPVEYLKQLPPAQPERIKGRWIAKEKKNLFRCSKCDAVIYSESEYDRNEFHKFCGRCGADMREVTE